MKAAVMFETGATPRFTDFPDPLANEGEVVLRMKAAAVKHLDKSKARGEHYSAKAEGKEAKVIGGDGVGLLPDGTRVYAVGSTGMIAEKAAADKNRIVRVPDALDDVTAAALPNAVIGSAMALLFKARLQPGETVLINGATGFTGKMAVQLAKHYGAGTIIATGRKETALQSLLQLGADDIIRFSGDRNTFSSDLQKRHKQTPVDVIIDYLWGSTAETIFSVLQGKGSFTHTTRFVSVGSITGDRISLLSEVLRGTNIQLTGSGLGSWCKEEVTALFTTILPQMFQLAADKKLLVETISGPFQKIESLWEEALPDGKRLVVVI